MEEINNNVNNESVNPVIENNSIPPIIETPSKQNNTFKILFIISILVVLGLVIFIFFLLKDNTSQSTIAETKNKTEETITVSPTIEAISPTVIQKSEISVFKESNSLYFSNSENNKTKIADNVGYYSLSSDKSKIAYVLSWEESSLNPYFYIYHISDKSTEKISSESETEITPSAIDWSPNDNFLVLNSGTDIVRNATFFDYQNKKNLFNIQLYATENGKTVEWISDTEFLFNEPQKVNPEIPVGAGYSTNITKMSVTTKQKEVLKQGTSLIMYRIIKNNNGTIYFKKDSVANSTDWFGDKESINYWKMDIDGNNLTQVDEAAI